MEQRKATITAVGHYVPDKILTNHDLEKMVDTSDEWIQQRCCFRINTKLCIWRRINRYIIDNGICCGTTFLRSHY